LMGRQPFVWQVHVRREVLEDAVTELRDLPYSLWRDLVDQSMTKRVVGRDGKAYRVRVSAALDGTDNIRVTISLEAGRWTRRQVLSESFVITPANTFID